MFRKLWITVLALGLSVGLGYTAGKHFLSKSHSHDSRSAARVETKSLQEEMYFVEFIVKGSVIEQNEPLSRNAGLPVQVNFNYNVTPSLIKVDELVYGDLDEDTITFLQHGTAKTHKDTKYLQPDEEVVLLLTKTVDNYYWSYSFEDGIWRVKDGTVVSELNNVSGFLNPNSMISKLQNHDVDTFVQTIKNAALNKKQPEF